MSRFIFATFGSLGDLHPYIAVGRALIERGQEAVIATTLEYEKAVTTAGVGFAAVGPGMSELGDYQTLVEKIIKTHRGPEYLIRNLVMAHVRTAYRDLMVAAKGADLLVSHPLSVTLPLVAAKQQIPWVSTVLAPMSLMSCYAPPLLPAGPWLQQLRRLGVGPYRLIFNLIKKVAWHWEVPLRKLRAELGMPPARQSALFEGQFSPFGNLALFDSVLAEPQPDWPVNTTVCGSPCFDGQILDPSHTVELETFLAAGPPPVVFALGSSAVWVAGDFWEKAVQAVQKLGLRAILVTGPQTPQGLPDGVCALPYLPYSHVFPKAAVVVHQAGVGTLAQALRASCPQLIVPLAFDQADNGQRAERLKLARVIPFRKVTVRGLVETLDHLLKNPEYAQNAWRVAALLAPQDGAALAAEELIRLAG